MACIRLNDLEMALGVENILLVIKLATLQHYFEMCQYKFEVNTINLSHFSCSVKGTILRYDASYIVT